MPLRLTITPELVCPICDQPIEAEDVHKGVLEGALFGWRNWGICPCCLQAYENAAGDPEYLQRCIDYVKENCPSTYARLTRKLDSPST